MNNKNEPCGKCQKPTSSKGITPKCTICKVLYHVKCLPISPYNFRKLKEWKCASCDPNSLPIPNSQNDELSNILYTSHENQPKPNKSSRCGACSKRRINQGAYSFCIKCSCFFHVQCSINKNDSAVSYWQCDNCSMNTLPFSKINDENLKLSIQGFSSVAASRLSNLPSFSMQSLLDQMPGQNFSTDEFLSNSIESKYYTPAEFMSDKLSKKSFTMIHLNIASLQCHIDELRDLLHLLNHPFEIICITETRLHDDKPLSNINIEGYEFVHTATKTKCGGAGIYIKTGIEYEVLNSYCISHHNISESMFIEIKNKKKKNIVIGCIYRHHTPVSDFLNTFLNDILNKIAKSNKTCALLGDFNIDLVKYGSHEGTDSFYDQISSTGFRPLILQPTRVTSSSATLIDNIFINNLECFSKGGNLTCSISDHFLQFSQIDIFDKLNDKKTSKFGRNWRLFNKREFEDELRQIEWNEIINSDNGTDKNFSIFFHKVEKLLDEMAPLRKLSKKELGLKKSPWITYGMLTSMRERDQLYKKYSNETDPLLKAITHESYKKLRNKIISLSRASKKQYYANYFTDYHINVKKTWDGIRDLINVSKKSSTRISKLIQDKTSIIQNSEISNTMNQFFVNIGSSVEAKIPQSKKVFTDYLGGMFPESITTHECSQDEILEIIQDFNTSKACGPFSIPTKIIKEFSKYLIIPLTKIVNASINEGVFPQDLKSALVCPIFKKGEKTKCGNYRPISLLSNISKKF